MPPPPAAAPPYGVAAPPTDGQAILSLVLGIASVVTCCVILGPVAFFLGNSSLNRIRASGGTVGGAGLAQAARILGIIATIFLGLGIIWAIVAIAVGLTSPRNIQ